MKKMGQDDLERLALLKWRIEESGASVTVFALRYMVRTPRTVSRWLAGARIPDVVYRWLITPPQPWPPQERCAKP